ncbi:MAG: polymerase, sigma-24 subunit, RpoE [Fibrobacteres bacterium]|nr:polymerase, sigma-24 subunit, RpoE [Fibrobacterota bacterium]
MSGAQAVPDLEQVFRKYRDFVYRTCYRYFRDPGDAEDLAQEVFLKLHTRLPAFRGDSALTTWIYRIAANCCIDALRSRRNHVAYEEANLDDMVGRNLAGHGDSVLARIDLNRILAHTDDRTREILFLSLAEGCSHEEVGDLVGMSKWAVTKTINRFKQKMQAGKKAWLSELFTREVP